MTSRQAMGLLLAATLIVTACGRPAENTSQTSEAARPKAEAEKHGADNVVTVSDEMLRDLRITTSTVEQRRGGDAATLLGELGVNENTYAEVGAPLQARIVALHATAGQTVQRNAALATLQSGELARARSDLATAQARVALAQRAFDRKQGLNAEHIVPTREVQEAENEKAAAEAQLRAAQASLQAFGMIEQAGNEPASTLTLRAPVAGVVLERAAVLGQVADPAKPLFRIADLSTLWLTVRAFERDAVRLHVGAPARITFAALPGRTFEGGIALIGRSVDAQSRTVAVRIDLPNRDGLLRPGMSASARLPIGDEAAKLLAVPAAALQRVRERWCVFLPKDERTFEIRPVGRGRDLGGEVEVVSGLRAGDTIVVDGAFLLKAETERGASEGEHEEHP
jgi:cobalt-zinc-cadmium efflux system membrane fusion protein